MPGRPRGFRRSLGSWSRRDALNGGVVFKKAGCGSLFRGDCLGCGRLVGSGGKVGQGRHQSPSVGMARGGEDLGGGSAFDDLAFVKNGDALADFGDRGQVVRNACGGQSDGILGVDLLICLLRALHSKAGSAGSGR